MELDVQTIFLTAAVIGLLIAGMQMLAYARLEAPALAYWAMSNFALGTGCAILALRDQLPAAPSTLLANGLTFVGLGLLSTGVRVFDGRRPRLDTVFAGAAAGVGALAFSYSFDNHLAVRVTIVSLVIAFWALAAGAALARSPRGAPILSRLVSAALLMAFAVLHFCRAGAVQFGLLPADAALSGPMQALALLAGLSLGVAWSLGSLFMVLDRMASHDDLTGLANRRTTLRRARLLFEDAMVKRRPLSVLMADLDNFKSINDRFGHQLGDSVLRTFARTAHQALRAGDLMGRYGGEEFCVVLPGADARAARVVAERLRAVVQESLANVEGKDTCATVTIGTASLETSGQGRDDVMRLINAADSALYEGKTLGRNRVASAKQEASLLFDAPHAPNASFA